MYLDAAQSSLTDGSFPISPNGRRNIFAPLPMPYNPRYLGKMYDTNVGHLWVRADGSAFEMDLTDGLGDWAEVELGLGFFKKAWGYVKKGARWVTRQVKKGYEVVVKKVKDFDRWMRSNVPGYNYVSDFVIEIGRETKVFLAEAVNGFIELAIYTAGVLVTSIIGSACAAGVSAGIPIPPDLCAYIAVAAGAATVSALQSLKKEVVAEWNKPASSVDGEIITPEPPASSPDANPINNGVQALAMGIAAAKCGMPPGMPGEDAPPGTLVTYLGREPNPDDAPCSRAAHWDSWLQQARFDPEQSADIPYYTCRRDTAKFECDKERMRTMGLLTTRLSVENIMGAERINENRVASLARLTPRGLISTVSANLVFPDKVKTVVKTDPEKEKKQAVLAQKKAKVQLTQLEKAESDNTYLFVALAVVGGGALYYAKKKGMF